MIWHSNPGRERDFLYNSGDLLWGPSSLLFTGYPRSLSGVRRPKHEADHLPPSSARLRMRGAVPLCFDTPAWCGHGQPQLLYFNSCVSVNN